MTGSQSSTERSELRRDCRHPKLNFGSGDYYLFCHDCGRWWCTIEPETHKVAPELANQGAGGQLSGEARGILSNAQAIPGRALTASETSLIEKALRSSGEVVGVLEPVTPAYAPKVRPLEWEESKGQLDGQLVWSAGDPWLFWIVKNTDSPDYIWCENFNIEGFFPCSPVRGSFANVDLAKAAAQADYEKRVLGALVVPSTHLSPGEV